MSAIPALKNHLARPDETARTPRDAGTQSGCQFPSQRASSCAFLLRLVSPAPLFTLADACLTLPMGSQTDTSRRSVERLLARGGRAECGTAPEAADTRSCAGRVTTPCRLSTAIWICAMPVIRMRSASFGRLPRAPPDDSSDGRECYLADRDCRLSALWSAPTTPGARML